MTADTVSRPLMSHGGMFWYPYITHPCIKHCLFKDHVFSSALAAMQIFSRIFRSFELKSFGLGWRKEIPSFCRSSNAAFCFPTTTETCCRVCFSTRYTFLAFTLCSPHVPLFEWQSDVSYALFCLWARTKRSNNPNPNISFRWKYDGNILCNNCCFIVPRFLSYASKLSKRYLSWAENISPAGGLISWGSRLLSTICMIIAEGLWKPKNNELPAKYCLVKMPLVLLLCL